ncbi:MAG TPA: hypothetical protein IAB63_09585 [Candidatus Onthocola gallistercoris]|uniref:Uncharacterized protein n=1 Tax=Candidatus Onthocola gallistercoris TaxID=2840876 RepID=A0A9D1HHT1_9FIRM|nr:hypothetical protein [Candidatus Onthocola gallistercoris]
MRYETFKDNVKLSKLGLGAMRLPQTEPGFAGLIDGPKAKAYGEDKIFGIFIPWYTRLSAGAAQK